MIASRLRIVATCERGRAALAEQAGVEAVPLDAAARAEVLWRRSPTSGRDVATVLDQALGLRWVHSDTAGVDDLPLRLLAERGVALTKTGAYTDAVAEWIVTAVLSAAKGWPAYVRASEARRWEPGAGSPRLASGSRAVIVGGGDIGSYAGAMLRGMGVRVEVVSRSCGLDAWPGVLGQADWLILACPLTEQTRGMIGAAELGLLPEGAWVINAARGEVVDEQALCAALDTDRVGGAVLDTVAAEPLAADSPLWGRPNVVITPHDAWRARGAGGRQVADFLAQLRRYRAGEPLHRTVDTAVGY